MGASRGVCRFCDEEKADNKRKRDNMKRWITGALALLTILQSVRADEGMWLMTDLGKIYPRMRAEGLKLKASAIYDEQTPALSDAVVAVDGGMGTGSMI